MALRSASVIYVPWLSQISTLKKAVVHSMTEQMIKSDDMTLKRVFQDFYRVPDYQREYVWGGVEPSGQRGEQVEQFLQDIHMEFEAATAASAPEYFIGTIVVCPAADGVMDMIDGQQRTTTTFLVFCAVRDFLQKRQASVPDALQRQISDSTTDWRGIETQRLRLDLQYDDAKGVLGQYANGEGHQAPTDGTRSIANIAYAYNTISEFLETEFKDDVDRLRRFYGYLTNKVKLIRIETPSVAKALKIFETINDRGVGLDAMDLLKNLLFMNASEAQFSELKAIWKAVADTIYAAGEKPLRFLRYFVIASYDNDGKLIEEGIYDWFVGNDSKTDLAKDPVGFGRNLLEAARAYSGFLKGRSPGDVPEQGLLNTRYLGGRAFKQHFILLLAGRKLPPALFSRLATEVERLVFLWLVTRTPTKDYERAIFEAASKIRHVRTSADLDQFLHEMFDPIKGNLSQRFDAAMTQLRTWDMPAYRLRYVLAKLTQHFDVLAYGNTGGHGLLATYMEGKNDIEHVLPNGLTPEVLEEFGEPEAEQALVQALGNLCLAERSMNGALSNKRYSAKAQVYPSSQFLLTKCQASRPVIGVNDGITKVAASIPVFPTWRRTDIEARQRFLSETARTVWGVPASDTHPAPAKAVS